MHIRSHIENSILDCFYDTTLRKLIFSISLDMNETGQMTGKSKFM